MPQRIARYVLLASLVLACGAIALFAQNTDYSKEPFVIESLKTEVVFNTDGTGVEDRFLRVRIQSDETRKQSAALLFPYSSEFERMEILEVTVKKANGRVVTIPESDVQNPQALDVGDTLQSHVRRTRTAPEMPGQFWLTYSFFNAGVVFDETLTVHIPREKQIKLSSPGHNPVIDRDVQHVIYSWKSSHGKAAPETPASTSTQPSIRLTTFQNWEELGRWYRSKLNSKAVLTPAIEAKAAELTRGFDSKIETERAIYAFVAAKSGDSKDKHILFAALLKAAGIDAWPALIGIDPDVPSPDQLNHVITYIPDADPAWFDTASEVTPFGMLLLPDRDKKALVIPTNGGEPTIMTTDARLPFPADETFEVRSRVRPDGSLSSRIDASIRGDSEVQLRTQKWPIIAQTTAASWGLTGTVSNVEVENIADPEKPLRFSFNYETKGALKSERPHVRPSLPAIAVPGAPGKTTVHAEIELPQGYTIAIPGNLALKTNFAEYSSTYSLNGNTVEITRVLTRTASQVSSGELQAYIRDDENRTIDLIRLETNATPGSNNNQVKILEISPLPKLETEEAAFKKLQSERNADTKKKLALAFEKTFPKSKHLPDVYIDWSRILVSQSDFTTAVKYADKAISAIAAIRKDSPGSDKEDPQWQQWINGLENSAKSNRVWTKEMLTWQQQQVRQHLRSR